MTTPQELLARNSRWCAGFACTDAEVLAANAKGQAPKVFWLGCADSRVPESVVCHAKPGEIFVHRNIANQFTPGDDSAEGALTFAVEALGVEHVVVVGHTSCGGVNAAHGCAAASKGLPSPALDRFLTPLISLAKSKPELDAAALVAESVRRQVDNVVASEVIKANWQGKKTAFPGTPAKKVEVHGWVYHVHSGKLQDLEVTHKPPQ